MNVDLPEPDGPVSATNSAGMHVERDAAQRADLHHFTVGGVTSPPMR